MKLVKMLVLCCATLFVNQLRISAMSPQLQYLLDDMKEYKTTNARFHAGHLYEHSIWVTRSIINLLEDKCAKEISVSHQLKKQLIIAGLLHDIGKGGDLQCVFFEKKEHPERGFQYITGDQDTKYIIKKTGEEFSFKKLFEELNFSDDERAFVAIIAGMHHDLGILMRGPNTRYRTRLDAKLLCEKTLTKLDTLIKISGYMGGNVNRKSNAYMQLICCICLVSSADVCASQVVLHADHHNIINDFFGIAFFDEANEHCIDLSEGLNAFEFFKYKTVGHEAKFFLVQCAYC